MNPDLATRLDMKEADLNKKIKIYTGMNKASASIHQKTNNDLD